MSKRIKIEDKYYISVDSIYADDRVLVLNNADTFGVFDRWGDVNIIGKEAQGIYHAGTRYISEFELKLNGERPVLLSSSIREENDILFANFTNADAVSGNTIILNKGSIYISRTKLVTNGMCCEKITVSNYDRNKHEITLSFVINADFKDIFEVRGIKRKKRGHITSVYKNSQKIIFIYKGLDDVERITEIKFSPVPDIIEGAEVGFIISLEPGQVFEIKYNMMFKSGNPGNEDVDFDSALYHLNSRLNKEKEAMVDIISSNHFFNHWVNRSRVDLISLMATTPFGRYPYAGVPWYNTPFGRDGIITALEVLWVSPEIAKGVLLYLAQTQSKTKNDYQDTEPGKIFHETRSGEMAELGEVPFKLYYGTIDATPLFVVLAGNYYRRTADLDTIKKIWPNIEAAIKWINEYGDMDNDGFVEYQHHSEQGLYNQGWKDSHDSISHEDGTLAESPIALCEVQGYVYDAKTNMAFLAKELGYIDIAESMIKEAASLKRKFNEVFWDDELKIFVLALDGDKKPCRVKSSNAGHCLFSGIVNEGHAQHLAATLVSPEMFSGWGVRTLSSDSKSYNPMSYHNGSIWPHDNALIASGLSKYGFQKEALSILNGLFEATLFNDLQRLPELFCGFDKRKEEGPVEYPVACSPQAWAVGSLYMLINACIRMDINAIEKKVSFKNPSLPDFIDMLEINNLSLDGVSACILLQKNILKGETIDISVKVINKPGDWEVVIVK